MKTYVYGFPRLGEKREFKKTVEGFWKGDIGENQLWDTLTDIQETNNTKCKKVIDFVPDTEVSLYDPMLDTAILLGIFNPQTLHDYYELCRGGKALEMTKWFNTNYHYLVTDFSVIQDIKFRLNIDHFALRFKKGQFPTIIGPFTFLKLSKGLNFEQFKDAFFKVIPVYRQYLSLFKQVQIDEPAFALDLTQEEIDMIKEGYGLLSGACQRTTVVVYYAGVDWLQELISLPVSGIGLDFIRGSENLDEICKKRFPDSKTLIAGLIDGRNVWRNDITDSVDKLKALSRSVKNLAVSNAAPLYHLPISLRDENKMALSIKKHLSFAEEKLVEIKRVAECFNGAEIVEEKVNLDGFRDETVRKRISALNDDEFHKSVSLEERKKIHRDILGLPLFPTTTIGSYPQTKEVRAKRAAFNKGTLTREEYRQYVHSQIDALVLFQENTGLDVFVHGEFERTDMVEFFAQNLNGILTTESGWIISYGTRTYRPPVIFGDISRPSAMTVDEIVYAQSRTKKPVKGMLTGAVTIIAWSFCREDIPTSDVAYQISLCLRDEIRDYEKAGIKIVQVDEAAFREKAPIKKRDWPGYFDWAVKSFNLATNTSPKTQIHTHMCYSEFGEIIEYINQMDFDVISIEAARSKGDIISSFEKINFQRQIGLGVWDIHSPAVPSVERMLDVVKRSLQKIPKDNFWLNPDCGLKTRQWPEVKQALANMVAAAQRLR